MIPMINHVATYYICKMKFVLFLLLSLLFKVKGTVQLLVSAGRDMNFLKFLSQQSLTISLKKRSFLTD